MFQMRRTSRPVQLEIWRQQPPRPCRSVGCDNVSELLFILRIPGDGWRPTCMRQLPLCQECAAIVFGLSPEETDPLHYVTQRGY